MSRDSAANLIFAADLGGTHLRTALIDNRGNIHAQLKSDTPQGTSPGCVVDALVRAARELGSTQIEGHVFAASIMVPGTVNRENAIVVRAPNVPCLDNFGLKAALENELRWPVLLENDANAAAVGEMWLGAARGFENVICLTLGTGVGGGIILAGKLWRGTDGSAGEIGHTTVDPFNGPKCKCGNTGCLEMFTSATAIVRMTREALSQFPESTMHTEELTALKVFLAGSAGDKLALEVFRKMGRYLGVGIANLITILGPEVIVIGGGAANAWQLFDKDMREQVEFRVFPAQAVEIKPAECGDNAGILGAAKLAFDQKPLSQV